MRKRTPSFYSSPKLKVEELKPFGPSEQLNSREPPCCQAQDQMADWRRRFCPDKPGRSRRITCGRAVETYGPPLHCSGTFSHSPGGCRSCGAARREGSTVRNGLHSHGWSSLCSEKKQCQLHWQCWGDPPCSWDGEIKVYVKQPLPIPIMEVGFSARVCKVEVKLRALVRRDPWASLCVVRVKPVPEGQTSPNLAYTPTPTKKILWMNAHQNFNNKYVWGTRKGIEEKRTWPFLTL